MKCNSREFLGLSKDILRRGNRLRFRAHGGSMWPFITDGDILDIEPLDRSKLKPKDIIFYNRSGKQAVAHRIIKILSCNDKISVVARGDFEYFGAETVPEEAILGRVTAIEKKGRVIYIDKGIGRIKNIFFADFSPFLSKWVNPLMQKAKRFIFKNEKSMRHEDNLILSSARISLEEEEVNKIKGILDQGLDWGYFLHRSRDEGTASLIYKTFLKIPDIDKVVPKIILEELKTVYYSVVKRNILILRTLEDILREFQMENIRTIIFKGLALAESLYGDIGSRSMTDVDILIKGQDLKKADKILKKLNYSAFFGNKDLPDVTFNLYRNSFLYSNLNAHPKYIHLYWHILNLYPHDKDILNKIDLDKIWDDSREIELGGMRAHTFSTHHQVLYLCMHALNHSFRPLILLCDINEFIAANKSCINWDKLIEEAYAFGLNKQLYYGLYIVSNIFSTDIPQEVFDKLKPEKISIFERKFISSVLKRQPSSVGESMVFFGMNENWMQRLSFLSGALFPSKREMSVIRQKKASEINITDYIQRLNSAFHSIFEALLR